MITWPLPRRTPDEKSDPLELLLDITFVLALSQSAVLLRQEPGAAGVLQAVAVLSVVTLMWQGQLVAVTHVVLIGPLRLLLVLQTGLFLAAAVALPEAYHDQPGGLDGPRVFAIVMTLVCLITSVMFVCIGVGQPHFTFNVIFMCMTPVSVAVLTWWSSMEHGAIQIVLIFTAVLSAVIFSGIAVLPIGRWLPFGSVDGWIISGTRVWSERCVAVYVVACALSLELLEQVGQSAVMTPGMQILLLAALLIAYLMFRLYQPMIAPARQVLDPRNTEVPELRRMILDLGYSFGHIIMISGLVATAGALSTMLNTPGALTGWLGRPVDGVVLVELYVGVALCLFGQACFHGATTWKVDWLRLIAALALVAGVPMMIGSLVLVPILVLVGFCAVVTVLDHKFGLAAKRKATEQDTPKRLSRLSSFRHRLQVRRWRPAIRFTGRDRDVSGFELLFDVLAAFTFAQTTVLVISDPTPEGALRGLLVLAMLWGCWMTHVWTANSADADAGTVHSTHLAALVGMVFLGLTLPMAFAEPGLNDRVIVFLAAYLLVRGASAVALWTIHGRTAGRSPLIVFITVVATLTLIALSTQVPAAARIPFWLAGLTCEAIAAIVFILRWRVAAPAHLAERYGVVVIIGLDMSLGGIAQQMRGQSVHLEHLLLIAAAIVSCLVIWWLYFDLLAGYVEHLLDHTDPVSQTRAHNRLAYGHYALGHLAVLAGMVSFSLGLRATANHLSDPHTGNLGPPLNPIYAVAIGTGLAVYILARTVMWTRLGYRPHPMSIIVPVASLCATPFLIGLPAITALAAPVTLGVILVIAETLSPRARNARATRRDTFARRHATADSAPVHHAAPLLPNPRGELREHHGLDHSAHSRFDLLDTDGDGVITWIDFTMLLHRINTDPTTAHLAHRAETAYRSLWTSMCDAMDLNNDHIITRDEYAAFIAVMSLGLLDQPTTSDMAPNPEPDSRNPLRLFTILDRNQDSTITLSELVEAELHFLELAAPAR